jgi:MFS family permease
VNGQLAPNGVPWGTMVVLMLAVFTVSMGFGIVLPLLPYFIERLLGAGADPVQVSRSTGLLTGIYMLAIFLFAPLWGWISDRYGRRPILLIALCGFSATMLAFALIENLTAVYAVRLLSGLFAAAVTPVALATVGDLATTEEARARRLTVLSIAGVSGFLLAPVLGVFISRAATGFARVAGLEGALAVPLMAVSLVALLVALAAFITLPRSATGAGPRHECEAKPKPDPWLMPRLFVLAFIVSAGIGTFEVGLALRGKQELGLTQYEIAVMFTACSLVMIVVQAAVFSPLIRPETTRWFIAPALGAMGVALVLVPHASDFGLMLIAIAGVAASAGILSPIFTYWISRGAAHAQGTAMGKQTAAASLGAAIGAASRGWLFDVAWLPGAAFLVAAGLTALGLVTSLGLPRRLLPRAAAESIDSGSLRFPSRDLPPEKAVL